MLRVKVGLFIDNVAASKSGCNSSVLQSVSKINALFHCLSTHLGGS